MGDTVATIYDGLGRARKIVNQDGTEIYINYLYGTPTTFGVGDQFWYCDFVAAVVTQREDSLKTVVYSDAFGRKRREVADSGGLHYVTRYEYDELDQLRMVMNPASDTTRYWYDPLGRVKYKSQPDLGLISYAYDAVGNVRFTQTEAQADSGRMTFNQYDDLNRLTLVGEMIYEPYQRPDSTIHYGIKAEGNGSEGMGSAQTGIEKSTQHEKKGGPRLQSFPNDNLNLNRLTDLAEEDYLNIAPAISPILTANPTLWINPTSAVPTLRADSSVSIVGCQLQPLAILGETTAPVPPFLKMAVTPPMFYDPRKGPGATLLDFENVAAYPHFPRIAISYDTLPQRAGGVWGNFPEYSKWDTIAPFGKIRNMKGHEVAVAWREHGGEPYHYSVMSYDERGRVEALLHYTESLGFDAVYYTYNSANLVTSVRVADPLRQHTTFYGYNYNGQVDSVWTHLEEPGSGVLALTPSMRADILQRPLPFNRTDSLGTADISYRYTPLGSVEQMFYALAQMKTDYWYNKRGWLDSLESQYTIVAPKLFAQKLSYDSVGRIIKQESKNGSQVS